MKIVALTGGIAMGKSTVALTFRRARIPVFDADAAVHAVQAPRGCALPSIGTQFPGTVRKGVLDRAALRRAVLGDPAALMRLERILHPLVREAERRFLARARRRRAAVAVLDLPLLFEVRSRREIVRDFDVVIAVSAPPGLQRLRAARRGRMTAAQLDAVLARQVPDQVRLRQADRVVRTGLSRHHANATVRRLLAGWRSQHGGSS